ncbi:MAG: YDG domain-containing protein [Clostridiales bacterium]|jgi:hypothetical protein|nr:YDG domain-containing protein [Clostridiales bacterium]
MNRSFVRILTTVIAAVFLSQLVLFAEDYAYITSVEIISLEAPVAGETPVTELTPADNSTYDVSSVTWTPDDAYFDFATEYAVSIELTAREEYLFAEIAPVVPAGTVTNVRNDLSALSFDVIFAPTEKRTQDPPEPPSVVSVSSTRVSLNPTPGCQYRIHNYEWQDSPVFDGLSPSSEYTFYARFKEDDKNAASDPSAGATFKTSKNERDAPSSPKLYVKTETSVTLYPIEGAEYSSNGTTWRDEETFDGLSPNTLYIFYARYKETDYYKASPSSSLLMVRTDKTRLEGSVSIIGDAVCLSELTVDVSALDESHGALGTLTYRWVRGSGATVSDKPYYVTQYNDIGSDISVYVSAENYIDSVSASTPIIEKQTYPIKSFHISRYFRVGTTGELSVALSELALDGAPLGGAFQYAGKVDNDNILGYPYVYAGSTLRMPYNSVAEPDKTSVVEILIKTERYKDIPIFVTVASSDKNVLSPKDISFNNATAAYDGSPKPMPPASVSVNDEFNFVYSYSGNNYGPTPYPPTNVGVYAVSVTVENDESKGAKDAKLTITPRDLSLASIDIPEETYDGQPKAPMVAVTDGAPLTEGVDYVTYIDEPLTNAGSYLVEIYGEGNYAGMNSAYFIVRKRPLFGAEISLQGGPFTYDSSPAEPEVERVDAGGVDAAPDDYSVSFFDNVNAGIAFIVITAAETGNFYGSQSTTFVIEKAPRTAPQPPEAESVSVNSVVIKAISGAEYSMNGAQWQNETVFDELSPNTAYNFYARLKEDRNYLPSPPSFSQFSTAKAPQPTPPAPTAKEITPFSVALDAIDGAEYSIDGEQWRNEPVFDGLLPNTTYTFYARLKEHGIYLPSPPSSSQFSTTKASQAALPAPTAKEITHFSVTLDAIDGAEYSMDGEQWRNEPVFDGLLPNTTYDFYARLKEDENHLPSPPSSSQFSTTKASQPSPSAPTARDVTSFSVALDAIEGAEYSMDGEQWRGETLFDGLSPNTAYAFYARLKETVVYQPSSSSAALVVTTRKAVLQGIPVISDMSPQYGDTLSVDVSSLSPQPLGALLYRWTTSGGLLIGQASAYTIKPADIGETIRVTVSAEDYEPSVDSAFTDPVTKREAIIIPDGGQNKIYRTADPAFTYSVSPPLVETDALEGALSREPGESAGEYPFTLGTLSNDRYMLTLFENARFIVVQKPIEPDMIEHVTRQNYTGSAITPEPAVYYDGVKLIKNADFEYSYENNVNAGTAKIIVTGKGDFSGEASVEFTIYGVDMYAADITTSGYYGEYDGAAHGISASDLMGGATRYSLDGASYTDENPLFTKAGSHSVHYRVTRDGGNFNPYYGYETVYIYPKQLENITIMADDKQYDNSVAASAYADISGGLADGDDVFADISAAFSDKDAGLSKTVTITEWSLAGEDAANYSLPQNRPSTTADITPKNLNASHITPAAAAKEYDGEPAAAITGSALSGVFEGDSVNITITGVFSDANAGTDKLFIVTGWSLNGEDAENYTLSGAYPEGLTGSITPKPINGASITVANTHVYDGSIIMPDENEVTVNLDGVTLNYDIDYVFTSNSIMPGAAIITVIGENNYNGMCQGSFVIDKAPAESPLISGEYASNGLTYIYSMTEPANGLYKIDGGDWQTSKTFFNIRPDTIRAFYAKLSETPTTLESAESELSVYFPRITPSAPYPFTLQVQSVNDETYSVTIPLSELTEYSFDGIAWSAENVKTGLAPGESVTGYKRIAARDGFNASDIVSASVVLGPFKAAAPKISPNGGEFSNPVTVTLFTETSNAKIYYTVDGGAPTTASAPYDRPFILDGSTTVKAIAIKDGLANSDVATAIFTQKNNNASSYDGGTKPDETASNGQSSNGQSSGGQSSGGQLPDGQLSNTELTTEIIGDIYIVTLSYGRHLETEPDGTAKVPNDTTATIQTDNGVITAPGGTTINPQRVILIPKGKIAVIKSDYGGTASIPGETMIYADGKARIPKNSAGAIITGANGATLKIPGGYTIFEDKNSSVGFSKIFDNPFTDLQKSDWFFEDVEFAYIENILAGTSETTFSPNMHMTRGMLVTSLGRLSGDNMEARGVSGFDDVSPSKYYYPYVEWAKKNGIAFGVGDNEFAPDTAVTRQDLTVIFMRYAEYKGIKLPKLLNYNLFSDDDLISGYAKPAVRAMFRAKIVSGKLENLFHPKENATRAEVAALIHRFVTAQTS